VTGIDVTRTDSNASDGALLSPNPTAIETSTGIFFDVGRPDPSAVDIRDIAHHLAHTCRYSGAVRKFYSVAEHSVLVADLACHLAPDRASALRLPALLHDAAEAYLADLPAPAKGALRAAAGGISSYDILSTGIDSAVSLKYGFPLAYFDQDEIRIADLWALRIEAADLLPSGGKHWRWPKDLPEDGLLPRTVFWPGGLSPVAARSFFHAHIDEALRP
jgi:hypothetical protein